MTKKIGLILVVTCACLLLGCSNPIPSTPNTLPPCLMIGDVLYYYTGREVPVEIDADSILGTITSTVSLTEIPTENGQSNMTPLLDCPYAKHEENIAVLMEEKWMLFEARNTDESVSEPDNAVSLPPVASDNTLISITSNGETTLPYLYWLWGSSWTGKGFVAADALQLIYMLPEIAQELPIVSYDDDFTVQYKEGVSFSYMSIYDDGFEPKDHIASYDNIGYLSYLKDLPEGTYYIGIAVTERGKYIESENQYEYSGTDCVFKLVVKQ